jgi:hypothetical protein
MYPTSKVVLIGVLATFLLALAPPPYPKCNRRHPGRQHRMESLAKQGDSRMGLSAAGHSVRYAIHRYSISDIVTEADIARADKDMYEFLKWKTGSASLLAAQWLTAGYQHYDSHADEAAASLLGYDLPGPRNQLGLPKELATYIKQQTDSAAAETNAEICGALFSEGSGSTTPGASGETAGSSGAASDGGVGGFVCEGLIELARKATHEFYRKLSISGDMLMGKTKFDIKDEVIARMASLRRNPPPPPQTAAEPGAQPQLPTRIGLPRRVPPTRQ